MSAAAATKPPRAHTRESRPDELKATAACPRRLQHQPRAAPCLAAPRPPLRSVSTTPAAPETVPLTSHPTPRVPPAWQQRGACLSQGHVRREITAQWGGCWCCRGVGTLGHGGGGAARHGAALGRCGRRRRHAAVAVSSSGRGSSVCARGGLVAAALALSR